MARFFLLLAVLALACTPLYLCGAGAEGKAAESKVVLYFFWGEGCPHCARAKPFLDRLQHKYPQLEIKSYEVMRQKENVKLLLDMARTCGGEATGVPTFFIGNKMLCGFSAETAAEIETTVSERLARLHTEPHPSAGKTPAGITLPILGRIDPAAVSLPLFTVFIAGLDSFNPCAFFVLLFLLSLLVHAHSRTKMPLIGSTFVVCSGLVYFLFMAPWLNLFLLVGKLAVITACAGVVALIIALINIKDFFFFKEGVSLTIPEQAKPHLFARMRGLIRAGSLGSMLIGTVVLALAANSYELLCTAGFPLIFTRVLTLRPLSSTSYYLYLAFYNCVYIIPLVVIVAIFVVTLGSRKLSEWQGRVLKLASGVMMLSLGLVLIFKPTLLNDAVMSLLVMVAAVTATAITAFLSKRIIKNGTNVRN